MTEKDATRVIYEECLSDDGFLRQLRMGSISESRFQALIAAINELEQLTSEPTPTIDRLVAACLFEVPFEVSNTIGLFEEKNS